MKKLKDESSTVKGARHISVLLQEVVTGLGLKKGDVVVDATLGAGGYSSALCEAIGPNGILVGLDQDADAVVRSRKVLDPHACTFHLLEENFRNLDKALSRVGVDDGVDAIVFDLGMSSIQLEHSGRGFSFQKEEPLLMTFKETPGKADITASHIVNTWSEESIANVLFGYGEERSARKIARAIVKAREKKKIETSKELASLVEKASCSRGKNHPATCTFQALRIAVNDEVRALREGLEKGFTALKHEGRMAVVSFHSIEDRVVKTFMVEKEKEDLGERIPKKPVTPSREEVESNSRSRSAKLRIFQKF